MSDTLADIILRLNQLTRMRKSEWREREWVEGFFFSHRDIFICLIGVRGYCGLAETALVKIMTMSWHPFTVMWHILSGNGHLMKI